MRAISWFLMLLACCSNAATAHDRTKEEQVKNAVDLLKSIGVTNLCVDDGAPTHSLLPRCNSSERLLENYTQEQVQYYTQVAWFDTWNILGIFLCLSVSCITAGLTVSLLSLDPLVLLIKMRTSETELEKKQAARLVSIVKRRHLLLVSLILCTAVSSEALPLFLQDLMPRYAAVLVAVFFVIIFGEVLPTIMFTGPNQLRIASQWAPVVQCIMCVLYPIAAPIAALCDFTHRHGEQPDAGNMYNRGELAALIRIQYEERMAFKRRKKKELASPMQSSSSDSETLANSLRALKRSLKNDFTRNFSEERLQPLQSLSIKSDEIAMVEGALQMKTRVAMELVHPLSEVFSISSDTVLNEENVDRIYGSAYSRIPVYERRQDENDKSGIVGIFLTRQLIMVKPSHEQTVASLRMHVPFCVSPNMNLVELVNLFQTGASNGRGGHMALVCAEPELGNEALEKGESVPAEAMPIGIITLEDVLEALLQEQIYDEMDAEGRIRCTKEEVEVEDDSFFYEEMP